MEDWQKNIITANLVKLIKETNCNDIFKLYLIENRLITKEEDEILIATAKSESRTSAAKQLYDLLMTRTNGYTGLISALQETDQTGPLKILQYPIKRSKPSSAAPGSYQAQPKAKEAKVVSKVNAASIPGESNQNNKWWSKLPFATLLKFIDAPIRQEDNLPKSFVDPRVKRPHEMMLFCNDENAYNLPTGFKGLFLIINIVKFDGKNPNETHLRKGSAVDTRRMEVVFGALGYEVHVATGAEKTFTPEVFLDLIAKFKARCELLEVASFGVFLGSHGMDGKLQLSNGSMINLDTDVFKTLCSPSENCQKTLGEGYWNNIPKMFFIQACRIREADDISEFQNCLISYACKSNTYAFRTVEDGSDYVAALTKNLCEHAWEMDLSSILKLVSKEVKCVSMSASATEDDIQEPEHIETDDFKKLYFNMRPV